MTAVEPGLVENMCCVSYFVSLMPYHVEWRLDTSQDDFLSLPACKMEVILDVDLKCPNTFYFGLLLSFRFSSFLSTK